MFQVLLKSPSTILCYRFGKEGTGRLHNLPRLVSMSVVRLKSTSRQWVSRGCVATPTQWCLLFFLTCLLSYLITRVPGSVLRLLRCV